jgi:hypothetical protein
MTLFGKSGASLQGLPPRITHWVVKTRRTSVTVCRATLGEGGKGSIVLVLVAFLLQRTAQPAAARPAAAIPVGA